MTHLKTDPKLAPSSLLFRMNADPSALWEQIDDYARALPNTPTVVREAAAEVAAEINRRVPTPIADRSCVLCKEPITGGEVTFVSNADPSKGAAHLACANAQGTSQVNVPGARQRDYQSELLRGRLGRAYHAHHGSWPQGAYITDTIAAFKGKFAQPDSATPTERAKVVAGFHTVARVAAEQWNRNGSTASFGQLGRAKIALDEISAAEPLAEGGDEPHCAEQGTCKAEDGSGTCFGCGRYLEEELEPIRERLRALKLVGLVGVSDKALDEIIYAVRGL